MEDEADLNDTAETGRATEKTNCHRGTSDDHAPIVRRPWITESLNPRPLCALPVSVVLIRSALVLCMRGLSSMSAPVEVEVRYAIPQFDDIS